MAGVDEQDHRSRDRALAQALATRRRADSEFTARGLVHHSDAGSQYTALAFTEELAEAGIAGSIGTVGDALDNALMESTIGLYKTECITPGARGTELVGTARRGTRDGRVGALVQPRKNPLINRLHDAN